jgi:hypothetical protein
MGTFNYFNCPKGVLENSSCGVRRSVAMLPRRARQFELELDSWAACTPMRLDSRNFFFFFLLLLLLQRTHIHRMKKRSATQTIPTFTDARESILSLAFPCVLVPLMLDYVGFEAILQENIFFDTTVSAFAADSHGSCVLLRTGDTTGDLLVKESLVKESLTEIPDLCPSRSCLGLCQDRIFIVSGAHGTHTQHSTSLTGIVLH